MTPMRKRAATPQAAFPQQCHAQQSVIVGIFLLFFAAIRFAGGPSEIIANPDAGHLSPFGAGGFGDVLTFALTVGPFYLAWQSIWQRIFASRTDSIAIRAGLTGIAIFTVVAILP